MSNWKKIIAQEWDRRRAVAPPEVFFPLICQGFDSREIVATVGALLTGRLTMGEQVKRFETRFAEHVGARHAVMVNSGSSALLLAMAAATNPARPGYLHKGDEVLVPAVCWPTSLWPIVQMGLKPVFVDVSPENLNVDPVALKKAITRKTRGFVAVHVLGNAAPMTEILKIVREHDLMLLEDTCESLGSRAGKGYLGTFGDFGCYSFYYSHHITTGEGGMIVCRTQEDYDLLRCLRSHGWSRDLSQRSKVESENCGVDPRFLFVNLGYNLRPMEVQAAFGNCQLDRLDGMNRTRNQNHTRVLAAFHSHPRWNNQFSFPVPGRNIQPVWFGLPVLINDKIKRHHRPYMEYLSTHGIENRPIISGNFARQPALKLAGIKADPKNFPGAEEIHHRGFFIGLHTKRLTDTAIGKLADIMLGYEFEV